MRHSAVFTCRSARAGEIYRALAPEAGGIFPRSEVKLALEGEDLLVVSAAAEDLPALRAALNLWLRLVSVAAEMLELAEKAGGPAQDPRPADGKDDHRPGKGTGGAGPDVREGTGKFGDAVMVIHGPEAFDRGDVALLLGLLAPGGAVVAGVMARTAAEESGLPVTFDGGVPSSVIARTGGRVFLVNHGKTPESGRILGEIVASRLPAGRSLVQLECSSRTVFLWNGGDRDREFARLLAGATGFSIEEVSAGPSGEGPERKIRGCIPGEAVLIEGIVIGTATADTVVLHRSPGGIRAVSGLRPKPHGLEKLDRVGGIDLSWAWCKSGRIRGSPPRTGKPAPSAGRVVVIDHRGHDLYRSVAPDTCGVLAIGDDTTSVCGHICSHLGIPVFGVVDGDMDGLLAACFPPGSVVVEVLGGRDDEAGRELAVLAREAPVAWRDWVARALAALGPRCRVIHPPGQGGG